MYGDKTPEQRDGKKHQGKIKYFPESRFCSRVLVTIQAENVSTCEEWNR